MDVNRDGLPDIVCSYFSNNSYNGNNIWINTGSDFVLSNKTLPAYIVRGGNDNDIRIADLDGDGVSDLIQMKYQKF